jgi:hypothetical protein
MPRRRIVVLLATLALLGVSAFGSAATASAAPYATLTAPADGMQGFDPSSAFTWTAADSPDGYWLWVGTSPGSSDVLNTGRMSASQTAYFTSKALPAGKTLYARMWTITGGVFVPAPDVAFTAAPALTYPRKGAWDVDTTQPFTWGSDFQAASYRLTIGTTQGASDLFDSGNTVATSASVPGLPAGRTLWARLTTGYPDGHTATNDIWFTAAARAATLTNPLDGAQYVDPTQPLTWDPVSPADGYWVWIGTSPGANDVVNSGKLTKTSYLPKSLPAGKKLYARLWTINNAVFAHRADVAFAATAAFTNPLDGAKWVDTTKDFTWGGDPRASSYRVSIGTTRGASDVFDRSGISATSTSVPGLPVGKTLWARLTAQYADGASGSTDVSFTAAVRTATLTTPKAGALFSPAQAFTWDAVGAAEWYWLWIGTSPGANDVVSSGKVFGTSYKVKSLPVGKTLYARLWTMNGGVQAHSADVPFTPMVAPTKLTRPVDGRPGRVLLAVDRHEQGRQRPGQHGQDHEHVLHRARPSARADALRAGLYARRRAPGALTGRDVHGLAVVLLSPRRREERRRQPAPHVAA